jgi:hypothetical protein
MRNATLASRPWSRRCTRLASNARRVRRRASSTESIWIRILLRSLFRVETATGSGRRCLARSPLPDWPSQAVPLVASAALDPCSHAQSSRRSGTQLTSGITRAGDGNRTRVTSLEGSSSAIELHPQTGGQVGCPNTGEGTISLPTWRERPGPAETAGPSARAPGPSKRTEQPVGAFTASAPTAINLHSGHGSSRLARRQELPSAWPGCVRRNPEEEISRPCNTPLKVIPMPVVGGHVPPTGLPRDRAAPQANALVTPALRRSLVRWLLGYPLPACTPAGHPEGGDREAVVAWL